MGLVVNGEEALREVIEAEVKALRARFQQLSPEQLETHGFTAETMERRAEEWARENVIERMLLRQKALEDLEPVPEEVLQKAVDEIYRRYGGRKKFEDSGGSAALIQREAEANVKLDRLVAKVTSTVKPVKTKDVAARYRSQKERWRVGETVRAAHIVKHVNEDVAEAEARAAIEAVQKELQSGAEFERIADQFSDCPGNGGSLGWFARGKMVEEFEDVVFAMEPGQVSEIFRSVFGFHIAKVYEKRPSAIRPLSEARAEIEAELKQERATKAIEDFVDALREKAVIADTAAVVSKA